MHEEILIAVQEGLQNSRSAPAVRTWLAPLAESVAVSRSPDDHPAHPRLVVLIGGWGRLPLLGAVNACRERFGECPTLAVLLPGQRNVAKLFGAGVSDCVRWPLGQAEFTARARARLRAIAAEPEAEVVLDFKRLTVRCNGVRASLTPKQFSVLARLLQEPARWTPSRELLKTALNEKRLDTTRLRFHVYGIRQKLQQEAWRLRSHRMLGYLFEVSQSSSIADLRCLCPKKSNTHQRKNMREESNARIGSRVVRGEF